MPNLILASSGAEMWITFRSINFLFLMLVNCPYSHTTEIFYIKFI